MSIFPALEKQLTQAACETGSPAATASSPRQLARGVRSAAAGLLLVAAVVAVISPWKTSPRPDERPAAQAAIDGVPIAVLGRPASQRDRRAELEVTLRLARSSRGLRAQSGTARELGRAARAPVVLFLAQEAPGRQHAATRLCVSHPMDVDARAARCWTARQVKSNSARARAGNRGRAAFGLVPDGVAAVRLVTRDGQVVRTKVVDNYFEVRRSEVSLRGARVQWLTVEGTSITPVD